MKYTYTETEIRISPFERHDAYIVVTKPVIAHGVRTSARITWSRFKNQHPISAYEFGQALFVAAGLADVLDMVPINLVKRFGMPEDSNDQAPTTG